MAAEQQREQAQQYVSLEEATKGMPVQEAPGREAYSQNPKPGNEFVVSLVALVIAFILVLIAVYLYVMAWMDASLGEAALSAGFALFGFVLVCMYAPSFWKSLKA